MKVLYDFRGDGNTATYCLQWMQYVPSQFKLSDHKWILAFRSHDISTSTRIVSKEIYRRGPARTFRHRSTTSRLLPYSLIFKYLFHWKPQIRCQGSDLEQISFDTTARYSSRHGRILPPTLGDHMETVRRCLLYIKGGGGDTWLKSCHTDDEPFITEINDKQSVSLKNNCKAKQHSLWNRSSWKDSVHVYTVHTVYTCHSDGQLSTTLMGLRNVKLATSSAIVKNVPGVNFQELVWNVVANSD